MLDLHENILTVVSKLGIIFTSPASYRQVLEYKDKDAQELLDLFQLLLDSSSPSISLEFRSQLIVATQRLSAKSGLYPKCVEIVDMIQTSDVAVNAGGFADIYRGMFQGRYVCLKVMRLYEATDVEEDLKKISREAMLWAQLRHPNVLSIHGLHLFRGRPCLVMPWMKNGDITKYLKNNPSVPRLPLTVGVARGLLYLHRNCVIHGDLKGANILVDDYGVVCIADFGISSVSDSKIPAWTTQSAVYSKGGSVRWQAPELFDMENDEVVKNSEASDVYAFGCVCYEIFTGRIPNDHILRDPAVMFQVKSGARPKRPDTSSPPWTHWGLTEALWCLMEDCWKEGPSGRPSLVAILHRLGVGLEEQFSGLPLPPMPFRFSMGRGMNSSRAISTRLLDRLHLYDDSRSTRRVQDVTNPQSPPYPTPPRPPTIATLASRALTNLYDPSKDLTSYLRLVQELRTDGAQFQLEGDYEDAFVCYSKAITLAMEYLPTHREYRRLLSSEQREELIANGVDMMAEMAAIKPILEQHIVDWDAAYSVPAAAPTTSTRGVRFGKARFGHGAESAHQQREWQSMQQLSISDDPGMGLKTEGAAAAALKAASPGDEELWHRQMTQEDEERARRLRAQELEWARQQEEMRLREKEITMKKEKWAGARAQEGRDRGEEIRRRQVEADEVARAVRHTIRVNNPGVIAPQEEFMISEPIRLPLAPPSSGSGTWNPTEYPTILRSGPPSFPTPTTSSAISLSQASIYRHHMDPHQQVQGYYPLLDDPGTSGRKMNGEQGTSRTVGASVLDPSSSSLPFSPLRPGMGTTGMASPGMPMSASGAGGSSDFGTRYRARDDRFRRIRIRENDGRGMPALEHVFLALHSRTRGREVNSEQGASRT